MSSLHDITRNFSFDCITGTFFAYGPDRCIFPVRGDHGIEQGHTIDEHQTQNMAVDVRTAL